MIGVLIEIENNLHEANFLDRTFNLRSRTYQPNKKPSHKLCLYILYQTSLLKSADSPHFLSARDYATTPPMKRDLNQPS